MTITITHIKNTFNDHQEALVCLLTFSKEYSCPFELTFIEIFQNHSIIYKIEQFEICHHQVALVCFSTFLYGIQVEEDQDGAKINEHKTRIIFEPYSIGLKFRYVVKHNTSNFFF